MDVKEAIKIRMSIRRYTNTEIPEDKLLRVLEAARLAPSGANKQYWKFIVVKDMKTREVLSKASGGQIQVAQAPIVIAAVSTMPEAIMSCGVPAFAVDLAIAIDHMTLAAVEEGLGTCWIGAFSQEKVCSILGIPASCRVVSLLTLGFPNESGRPKIRKSLDEIVCYETYT